MTRSIILLLTEAVSVTACVIRIPGDGTVLSLSGGDSLEVRDGTYYVHGVALRHERWVAVEGLLDDAPELVVETAAGDIDVSGGQGRRYALEVLLRSEIQGDGEVVLEDGRLEARALGDGEVLMGAIRGTVPEGLATRLSSGMGDVKLADFSGSEPVSVESGMGKCIVRDSAVGDLEVESGMGAVELHGVVAADVAFDSGMGGGTVRDSRLGSLSADLGMGSLDVRDSTLGALRADLGMGSLNLVRSAVEAIEADLGMGDLIFVDTARPARCEVDCGMGRVKGG